MKQKSWQGHQILLTMQDSEAIADSTPADRAARQWCSWPRPHDPARQRAEREGRREMLRSTRSSCSSPSLWLAPVSRVDPKRAWGLRPPDRDKIAPSIGASPHAAIEISPSVDPRTEISRS